MEYLQPSDNNDGNNKPMKTLPISQLAELKNLRVCFCIDISGSTGNDFANNMTFLDVEKLFAQGILSHLKKNASSKSASIPFPGGHPR